MSSFDLFHSALRIKEEPSDVSQDNEDDELFDKTLDSKNLQHLRFLRENQIPVLHEYDDNFKDELNKDMKIVFECEYAKLTWNLAAVKKIDEDSQNLFVILFRAPTSALTCD
ncbi:uncharacterized protein LOC111693479 [Trichogramma pretiosum]|uniref:uncharacterized protein LOC111693479 n=1 Tax=Trichogramma pretiosum TaxID=7493 RepID=UPI000C71AA02|nr:uncharacterized protein LOC111693479 [Trichogramma pretiosum]